MKTTAASSPGDQVILVDKNDQQIGVMDKIKAHRHPAQLHRASSVLLYNSQGEWLVQQRSSQKIVGANQWANTCCGNVRPKESYQACALRRLKEELGIIQVELKEVTKFTYQVECNHEFGEHEIDTVFMGQYDLAVEPNFNEVQAFEWLTAQDLLEEIKNNPDVYAPWTQLVLEAVPNFQKE